MYRFILNFFVLHLQLMNQSTNYADFESWQTDMDSSGGGLDHSADSNLSSSDNDRINSSPDNLLKGTSTSTSGNKFNFVSLKDVLKYFYFTVLFFF